MLCGKIAALPHGSADLRRGSGWDMECRDVEGGDRVRSRQLLPGSWIDSARQFLPGAVHRRR